MKSSTQKELYVRHQVVDVAIVTVCRYGFEETVRLIESFHKHIKSVTYRIVVVGDGPMANEVNRLLKKYPFIKVIRTLGDKGLVASYNIGANVVDSRYVLFIKNDVYVNDDIFSPWLDMLTERKEAAAFSPLVLGTSDGKFVEFAGSSLLTRYRLHRKIYHGEEVLSDTALELCHIPYLSNVAMMVRQDAFKELGGPSGVYKDGYEELDWSILLEANGYKLLLVPGMRVYHIPREKTEKEWQETVYNTVLGRLLFIYRNRMGLEQKIAFLYSFCFFFPKMLRWRRFLPDVKNMYLSVKAFWQMSEDDKMDSTHYRFSYFTPSE